MMTLDTYYAACNEGRVPEVLACYTADAALEEVSSGKTRRGTAALREGLERFFDLFPGLRFDCAPRIVAGDSILCPYVMAATVARDLGPVRLAGRPIRLTGAHLVEFDGDRIRKLRDFWDFSELADQARKD